MLPFLKNRQEGAMSGEDEPLKRDHDEGFDMLEAVAGDILEAIKAGDKSRLKAALGALVEHIQSEDQEQDQEMG